MAYHLPSLYKAAEAKQISSYFPFSKRVGSSTYYFYVGDKGYLHVDVIRDGLDEKHLIIEGLASIKGLDSLEKQRKMRLLLEASNIDKMGHTVFISAKRLGGWGDEVHYDRTLEWCINLLGFPKPDAEKIAKACNGVDKGGTDPFLRAYSCAAQSWHFNRTDDEDIYIEDPRIDGGVTDTRIIHAIENLHAAISLLQLSPDTFTEFTYQRKWLFIKIKKTSSGYELYRKVKNAGIMIDRFEERISTPFYPTKKLHELSLFILGEGLHALQDIFAHTEIFVKQLGKIQHHLSIIKLITEFNLRGNADKPKIINDAEGSPRTSDPSDTYEKKSKKPFKKKKKKIKLYNQRYTNTKWLTIIYLSSYCLGKKLEKKDLSHYAMNALEIASTPESKKKDVTEIMSVVADLSHQAKESAVIQCPGLIEARKTLAARLGISAEINCYASLFYLDPRKTFFEPDREDREDKKSQEYQIV